MLKLVIVLAVIIAARVRGGAVRHLAALPLRMPAIAVAGFALQATVYIAFRSSPQVQAVAPFLFVSSLVVLAAWCALNARLPGMLIVMVGLLLNTAAIVANGGYMPAWGDAARYAGHLGAARLASPEYDRRWMTTDDPGTPLLFLGDVLALPDWLPMASVWSIGDVLMVVGVSVLCWRTIRGATATGAGSAASLLAEERA